MAKKKRKLTMTGIIKDGKFGYDSPAAKEMYNEFISKHDGEGMEVTFKVISDMKTYQQIKFYYGAILPAMIKATGQTDVDLYLKGKYLMDFIELPPIVKDGIEKGEVRVAPYIPSKADLTIEEMSDYIESCLNELIDAGGQLDKDTVLAYEVTR